MTFRIGTFNLQNLVLPGKSFYNNRIFQTSEYEMKKKWTSDQIVKMNTDIIGFQEVFHKEALVETIQMTHMYPVDNIFAAGETGTDPVCGLASRFPVKKIEFISGFPGSVDFDVPYRFFLRPIIKALIELPNGLLITVFVAHLKSKRPVIENEELRHDFLETAKGEVKALIIRGIEAFALRVLVLGEIESNKNPVILLGDLNDSFHSITTDIISGKEPKKQYPLEVKQKIWDTLLYSAAEIQIKKSWRDVYYTNIHNGRYESLDHILVSQEFAGNNPQGIGVIEYMQLFNDHLLDYSYMDEKPDMVQSDHGQVVASIKLK